MLQSSLLHAVGLPPTEHGLPQYILHVVMDSSKSYQRMPKAEKDEDVLTKPDPCVSNQHQLRPLIIVLVLVIVTLLVLPVVATPRLRSSIFSQSPSDRSPAHDDGFLVHKVRRIPRCKMPPSKARAEGCMFDPSSFNWLPSECHDQDLVDEFLNITDWKWYTIAEGSDEKSPGLGEEVPLEEALKGEYQSLMVSDHFHFMHCVMAWKKLHRSLEGLVGLDGFVSKLKHSTHCGWILDKVLTDGKEASKETYATKIMRGRPTCYERANWLSELKS